MAQTSETYCSSPRRQRGLQHLDERGEGHGDGIGEASGGITGRWRRRMVKGSPMAGEIGKFLETAEAGLHLDGPVFWWKNFWTTSYAVVFCWTTFFRDDNADRWRIWRSWRKS